MRTTTICLAAVAVFIVGVRASATPKKKHALPAAQHGGTVIGLCDGETSVEVLTTGTLSREQAQAASNALMREWKAKHPEAHWDDAVAQNTLPASNVGHGAGTSKQNAPPTPTSGQGTAASGAPVGQSGTYQNFTRRDEQLWNDEVEKFANEGNQIFHDAKKLGGTIGVSCDMCHPNAANTHPETYPKFQVQLGRVALLRDMINWCIENPVKGKALHDDDDRLRALEAYIISQRKGVPLAPGKH